MKMFTKFWQVMMILLLSSSVSFAQVQVDNSTLSLQQKGSLTGMTDQQKTDLLKQQKQQDVVMTSNISTTSVSYLGVADPAYINPKPVSNYVYDPKNFPVPDQGGDNIGTAVVLAGALPIVSSGTTAGYLNDYDEVCPYTGSTAPDVVYSYTPAASVAVDIDLCGSSYDTKVFVYENAYTPGAPFACNDDFYTSSGDPCGQWVSKIGNASLIGGNTYYIVIDGYSGADFGAYNLEIRLYAPPPPCVWGVDILCPPGATTESEACGADVNGGCNMDPGFENWEPVSSTGETFCGTTWADGGTRDTDWYELILGTNSTVILSADADQLIIYGAIADANGSILNPTCATVASIAPNNYAGPCSESSLNLGPLVPGTYWFFVGMTVYEGFPCTNNYWFDVEVIPVACPGPTGLTTTPFVGGATANWTAGGSETLWNIDFGPAGHAAGTGTVIYGLTSPTYVINVANYGAYTWFVQADCGTDAVSGWSGPGSFSYVPAVSRNVYGYNAYANLGTDPVGPVTFNLATPGTITSIADQSTLTTPFAGTWAKGFWWAIDYTVNDLIQFNPSGGARTIIGNTGIAPATNVTGLAYDQVNDIMYCIDGTNLYTVNMSTGVAAIAGAHGNANVPINLACSPAGVLYTVTITDDVLHTVSPTGVFTQVGAGYIGFDASYAQDMEFDQATGYLYMAALNATVTLGQLYWMDLTTGAGVKVGDFEGGMEVCAFAIPYGYDINGTILYGNNAAKPMGQTPAKITQGTSNRTNVSDCNGLYGFNGLSGTYSLTGSSDKTWGGCTTVDAGLAKRVALGLPQPTPGNPPYTALQTLASDANGIGGVTTVDAAFIKRRALGLALTPTQWVGDTYIFETISVTAGGTVNLGVLCRGDINGSLSPIPVSCIAPFGLGVNTLTMTSANLTWTSNYGLSNLEWGPVGFVQGTGTLVNNIASPYAVGGLTMGTSYSFYVQDICCGGVGTSNWVGPYTFTTLTPLPGESCALPISITLPAALPYANTNTTCGMIDNYNATTLMGSYDGGEDILYEIVVTSNVKIDITLDPLGTTWTGIGLFNGCPDLNVGIVGSNNSGSTVHGVSNVILTPGTYFLMIDTWPSPTCIPTYNLTIVSSPVGVYCAATTSTFDEYISNVTFGTINNTTSWQGGVEFLGLSTTIAAGGSAIITVTNPVPYASDKVTCWVDWNNDFTYDVATEQIVLTNVGGTGASFSQSIPVPMMQAPGNYRMRVRMTYSVDPVPCGASSYGEVEEYIITVP